MRGRDHAGSLETVIPLQFLPIGPRQQPRDLRGARKGQAEVSVKAATKRGSCALRRFSFEAVDEGGQITFIRAR